MWSRRVSFAAWVAAMAGAAALSLAAVSAVTDTAMEEPVQALSPDDVEAVLTAPESEAGAPADTKPRQPAPQPLAALPRRATADEPRISSGQSLRAQVRTTPPADPSSGGADRPPQQSSAPRNEPVPATAAEPTPTTGSAGGRLQGLSVDEPQPSALDSPTPEAPPGTAPSDSTAETKQAAVETPSSDAAEAAEARRPASAQPDRERPRSKDSKSERLRPDETEPDESDASDGSDASAASTPKRRSAPGSNDVKAERRARPDKAEPEGSDASDVPEASTPKRRSAPGPKDAKPQRRAHPDKAEPEASDAPDESKASAPKRRSVPGRKDAKRERRNGPDKAKLVRSAAAEASAPKPRSAPGWKDSRRERRARPDKADGEQPVRETRSDVKPSVDRRRVSVTKSPRPAAESAHKPVKRRKPVPTRTTPQISDAPRVPERGRPTSKPRRSRGAGSAKPGHRRSPSDARPAATRADGVRAERSSQGHTARS